MWLINRLPSSTRNWKAPYTILSHTLACFEYLLAFGCLCSTATPRQVQTQRGQDHHFADKGELALYLGPSELRPGHVVYGFTSKKVMVVPKLTA